MGCVTGAGWTIGLDVMDDGALSRLPACVVEPSSSAASASVRSMKRVFIMEHSSKPAESSR